MHEVRRPESPARTVDTPKRASCHPFRHSFATHLLQSATEIGTVQSLPRSFIVETSIGDLHLIDRPGRQRLPAGPISTSCSHFQLGFFSRLSYCDYWPYYAYRDREAKCEDATA